MIAVNKVENKIINNFRKTHIFSIFACNCYDLF